MVSLALHTYAHPHTSEMNPAPLTGTTVQWEQTIPNWDEKKQKDNNYTVIQGSFQRILFKFEYVCYINE